MNLNLMNFLIATNEIIYENNNTPNHKRINTGNFNRENNSINNKVFKDSDSWYKEEKEELKDR